MRIRLNSDTCGWHGAAASEAGASGCWLASCKLLEPIQVDLGKAALLNLVEGVVQSQGLSPGQSWRCWALTLLLDYGW